MVIRLDTGGQYSTIRRNENRDRRCNTNDILNTEVPVSCPSNIHSTINSVRRNRAAFETVLAYLIRRNIERKKDIQIEREDLMVKLRWPETKRFLEYGTALHGVIQKCSEFNLQVDSMLKFAEVTLASSTEKHTLKLMLLAHPSRAPWMEGEWLEHKGIVWRVLGWRLSCNVGLELLKGI